MNNLRTIPVEKNDDILSMEEILEISGLDMMQGILDGVYPPAPISKLLNYNVHFVEKGKVVWILPLGRVVITAHAIALSRIVPYHPPCNVPIGLREAKLGFPLKTTLPFSTKCTL